MPKTILAFVVAWALVGCVAERRMRDREARDARADGDTWTVLVYGHADNNLSNSLLRDMQEMSKATLGDDVTVLVVADWDASQAIAEREERFPEGTELYRIVGGGELPLLVATEPEQDLDRPDVLETAIVRAFTEHPADRYALILWDHGGAWDGGFGADSQNGTVTDHEAMTVVDLSRAVRSALDEVGLEGERPLDLLVFDTCLMGGVEVAYELRELAAVYVANAEIDYGDGWDYEATLSFLAERPDATAIEIAEAEVAHWDAHHREASFSDRVLRSHVALDTTALDDLAGATADVVAQWAVSPTVTAIDVGRTASGVLPPYSKTLEQGDSIPALRDVGQLFAAIEASSTDPDVALSAAAARGTVANATIARSQGAVRELVGQMGLHIEMSPAAHLDGERLERYGAKAGAWGEDTGWSAVLEALAGMNDAVAPDVEHAIDLDDTSATITFSVADEDVARATVEIAIAHPTDPSRVFFFGLAAASPIEPASTYSFAWNGTLTSLGEDGAAQPVQVVPWMEMGLDPSSGEPLPAILGIPVVVSAPGSEETAQGMLLLMDGDAEVEILVLTEQSVTFMLADLARDFPGVQLAPAYTVYDVTTGEVAGIEAGEPIAVPATGRMPIGSIAAPAGQYLLVTTAFDVWGNVGRVLDTVDMPL